MSVTRTTLNIDDELLRRAEGYTGTHEKTALIHKALNDLIAREAAGRLAALGGSMRAYRSGRRRRPENGK